MLSTHNMVVFFQPTDLKFNMNTVEDQQINSNIVYCDSWLSLQESLKFSPSLLVIDESVCNTQNISIISMINTIQTTAALNENFNGNSIKILLTFDKLCQDKDLLKILNNTPNLWITDRKIVKDTVRQLLDYKTIYHQTKELDEVSTLSTDKLLYLRDEVPTSLLPQFAESCKKYTGAETIFSTSWQELMSSVDQNVKYIMLHISVLERSSISIPECTMMLETLLKFNKIDDKVKIAVIITKATPYDTIKILQKNNVSVIVPAILSWGIDEAFSALDKLGKDEVYYPKHIIDSLPGAVKVKKISKETDITLSARQKEVFNLIAKRGLSNKQIAKVLKISESTVKIHVSAILRTLCVRNRTQLALTKI